jgi:hypothetical protein
MRGAGLLHVRGASLSLIKNGWNKVGQSLQESADHSRFDRQKSYWKDKCLWNRT